MGLLDDLLGQLAGGPGMSNRQGQAPRAEVAGGASMSAILMALLPVVLAMLGNRRGGDPSAGFGRAGSGGGGLGEQARSWVGTGENQALPPGALEQIFGQDGLAEIARRAGLSQADAARGLTQLMPEVVDRVTPRGEVPGDDDLLASVDALAKRLGI